MDLASVGRTVQPIAEGTNLCPEQFSIRCSIVVSISACHAEDPGSIPGGGVLSLFMNTNDQIGRGGVVDPKTSRRAEMRRAEMRYRICRSEGVAERRIFFRACWVRGRVEVKCFRRRLGCVWLPGWNRILESGPRSLQITEKRPHSSN